MALLFMDGFDHYDDNEIGYKWDHSAADFSTDYYKIISTNPRRVGSNSLWVRGFVGADYIIKNINFGDSRCILGVAFRLDGVVYSRYFIVLYNETGAQFTIKIESDGSISMYRGNYNGTLLGTSSPGLLSSLVWYYIEINVLVNNSTGSYEIRLNGANILSDSGVDTQDEATDTITRLFLGPLYNEDIQFDDLYVCDGTGSSHNDFLGDCKVDTVFPSAAGNYSQWTPSGEASNYLCVDETVPNDDTDYVTTNISGEIDTYNFGNLVDYSGETIHAVALNTCKKKDDVGFMSSYPVIRIGASDYSGEITSTYDSYLYQQEIWETNPDDSQAWEEEDINSGEYGIKMQEN
jgi:hypothetical protein